MSASLAAPELALVQAPNFAQVSIPRSSGPVLSVIVWIDVDDDGRLILNGAEGRVWPAALRRTGEATVTVWERQNPYEYLVVECDLEGESQTGADQHFEALAEKYHGDRKAPPPGGSRMRFALRPRRIRHYRGS